jgi:hypothetical protein
MVTPLGTTNVVTTTAAGLVMRRDDGVGDGDPRIARTMRLRFFETNRLTPFGIYCLAAGINFSVAFAL